MEVSGPGIGFLTNYWDTVISVDITAGTPTDPTAGTWSVDYPDYTQDTTTTLTASPASPQTPPASSTTLTATVSPATAGTVTFWAGSTQVGTTQTVTSTSGVATVTTTPPDGTTDYTAVYAPAVGSSDIGSSGSLSYLVGTAPPAPTWEPVAFGPHQVGGTEYCVAGFQNATSVLYSWQADGVTLPALDGVTSDSFQVPDALLGDTLTCSVVASNGSSAQATGTSAPTPVIMLGAPLVAVKAPALSGPHAVGKKESVSAGRWSPAATKVTYQWYLGSKKISGATKSSFTPSSSDKGKSVHCVVTASAPGYANGTFTTAAVKIT
jgi:hypothetical protein